MNLVQNVGFYQKRLASAGIKPSSIKTLDDIKKSPSHENKDLRESYPFGFFAVPKIKSCEFIQLQELPVNPP